MGLDMYLSKKRYAKSRNHTGDDDQASRIDEVAYWRKANHIHKWFVDHVQKGNDDCREYYVSRKHLKALLDTVNTVLHGSQLVPSKITNGYTVTFKGNQIVEEPILEDGRRIADPSIAMALLPTQAGFFFGSTDYDQYYYADLEYTRGTLTKALAEADDGRFYYQSSW
jgi:hypothetical protein